MYNNNNTNKGTNKNKSAKHERAMLNWRNT